MPTPYLEDLDISECDLTSLWHDSSNKGRIGELLKNLKFLNASNNEIKHIFTSDLSVSLNSTNERFQFTKTIFLLLLDDEKFESFRFKEQLFGVQ